MLGRPEAYRIATATRIRRRLGRTAIPQTFFVSIFLYVVLRFLWPLHLPAPVTLVVAALMFIALQYHEVCRFSSGSRFAPEFPRPFILLFNWAMGTIFLLFLMQVVLDIAFLVALPFGGFHAADSLRFGMAGVAAVVAAYGVQQATRVPPVKEVAVAIAGLPSAFEGYTLVQLTDLHISRLNTGAWARAVVARTNALDPDLIVVTGDLIDGTLAARRADLEPLRELQAPDGVYVVSGNHERIFGYRAYMDHYATLGLRVLDNARTLLQRGGNGLVLAGLSDLSVREAARPPRDLDAVLADAPPGAPVLLLDHQPRAARDAAERGVALQLSGHTHGGLVVGVDRLAAKPNGGFVSGAYRVGAMTLYVNNGTALWPGFALRLGRPSELTRITLHRKEEPGARVEN